MPPFHFVDSHKQVVGINIDILKRLLEAESIRYQISLYPWSRSYTKALQDPRGGVISTAKVPSRIALFKWVGPFTSTTDGVYLFKLNRRKDIVIDSVDDLRPYIVGYVRDGVYEEILRGMGLTDRNLLSFTSYVGYLKMLFSGKVDLGVGSQSSIAEALKSYGYPPDHVVGAYRMGDLSGNYLALNPKVPDALVERLNQRLIQLKKSNVLIPIIKRYTTLDKVRLDDIQP